MKLQKNPAVLSGLALLLGLGALGLRLALYRTCVDEKGLLTVGSPLELGIWILTGAACVLAACSGGSPRERRSAVPEAVGELLGALGTALVAVQCLPPVGALDAARLALCLAAAVGLGWGAAARLRGKKPPVLCYGIACLFFALNAVCCYRGWVSHPQLQSYLFPLLGALSLMAFAYLRCVPGKYRLRGFVGRFGGFVCLAAAAGEALWPMFALCGLWLLTNADVPGEPL